MKIKNKIKKSVLGLVAIGLRSTAEKTANLQCFYMSYEPKIPQALKKETK